jgi:hypothetical protein
VILVVLLALFAIPSIRLLAPAPAHARGPLPPVRVGVSFSPERARALGLDYQAAFHRLLAMHFRVIRLSAYWSEIDESGYGDLDWLMSEAQRSRQPIVLSVGMKGLGWPEFFVAPAYLPPGGIPDGQDVARDDGLRQAALRFVDGTVRRYQDNRALIAWQVENEPFNLAGLHKWSIDASFLEQEIEAVRELDDHPIVVNAFSHFNFTLDQASQRQGFDLGSLLGFDSGSVESQCLEVLDAGDVLGLDVYTRIGYSFLGQDSVGKAGNDWADQAGRWHAIAEKQGKRAWVTEAQAEPWESSSDSYADPRSFHPADIAGVFNGLKEEGFTTIMLWGSEYWLWRASLGDESWLDAAGAIVHAESHVQSA